MADEFTTLLKYLWTEDERIEFEGEFYQSYGGIVSPKPLSNPRPVIMSAGNSDVGIDFACRQADWAFVTAPTLQGYKDRVSEVHRLAAKYNRKVRAATMVYVIEDSTDARAEETKQWLEDEVDEVATRNFLDSMKRMSYMDDYLDGQQGGDRDPWAGVGK